MSAAPTGITITLPPALVEEIARQVAASIGATQRPTQRRRWLTVPEIAVHVSWSPDRVYRLTAAGAMPCRRIGSRVLFDRDEVDTWLDEHREGPRPRRATA